jgi:hypothetical protein
MLLAGKKKKKKKKVLQNQSHYFESETSKKNIRIYSMLIPPVFSTSFILLQLMERKVK